MCGPEPERRAVQRELDVLDGAVVGLVRLVLHEAERLDEEAGAGIEVAVVDDRVDRGGHAPSSLPAQGLPSPAWSSPRAPRPGKLKAWVTMGYSPSSIVRSSMTAP